MISLPGISQLLGCSPVGPLGWSLALLALLALLATGAAVVGIAAAPHLLPAQRNESLQDSTDTAPVALATVRTLRPVPDRAGSDQAVASNQAGAATTVLASRTR